MSPVERRLPPHTLAVVEKVGVQVDAAVAKRDADLAARNEAQKALRGLMDFARGLVTRHPADSDYFMKGKATKPVPSGNPYVLLQVRQDEILDHDRDPVGTKIIIQAVSRENSTDTTPIYTLDQTHEVAITVHNPNDVQSGEGTSQSPQDGEVESNDMSPDEAFAAVRDTLAFIAVGLGEEPSS